MTCPSHARQARSLAARLAQRLTTPALACLLLTSLSGCSSEDAPNPVAEVFPKEAVELIVDELGISHVYAKNDADAFYEFHRNNGVEIVQPIGDREYEIRDYAVRDLYGYVLSFGHRLCG